MYRLLVESVTDYGMVMLNREGRLEMWNAGAEDITGYGAEEIVGRHVSCLYSPDDVAKEKPKEELATAVRLGRCEGEGWWVRKDGTRFWADVITTRKRGGKSHVAPLARLPALSLRVRVFDMASTRFLRRDGRERLPGIACVAVRPQKLGIRDARSDLATQ
jgi:PAS domain S-box-containing protein